MKKLLSILPLLALTTLGVQGQGYVIFANFDLNYTVDKYIYDAVSSDPLDSDFVAQLYAGPANSVEGVLAAMDIPVQFFDSPANSVGEFFSGEIAISGVTAGDNATLQVRVWPTIFTTWDDAYSAAQTNSAIHVGKSATFQNATGTSGSNVEMVFNMPIFTAGVVPEPSTIVLGILGLALPLLRRKF